MNVTIDQTLLADIFKAFSAKFNEAANGAAQRGKRDLTTEDLAMIVHSTGASTSHAWINQIPGMKKWVGERTIEQLTAGVINVVNEDYESTVSVPRNAIEDDSYHTFAAPIAAMGDAARELWLDLAVKALIANAAWADGNKFFCSGRKFGDTETTFTNASKDALSETSLKAALAALRSCKLHGDRASGVLPQLLVVGPDLEYTAAKLVEADLVANGTATETNLMKGVLTVKVHHDIPAGQWFVMGVKNTVKAVCVQKRKEGTLTAMTHENDDNVFMRNEYLYGTHARGEAFLTLPFLAYAGGLSSVTAWAAVEE